MSGAELIAAERQRQIDVKGWTPEHDAEHAEGDLHEAAAAYILYAIGEGSGTPPPDLWPWEAEAWKPSDDPVRNLVKAGALIAADIDRLIAEGAEQ